MFAHTPFARLWSRILREWASCVEQRSSALCWVSLAIWRICYRVEELSLFFARRCCPESLVGAALTIAPERRRSVGLRTLAGLPPS